MHVSISVTSISLSQSLSDLQSLKVPYEPWHALVFVRILDHIKWGTGLKPVFVLVCGNL